MCRQRTAWMCWCLAVVTAAAAWAQSPTQPSSATKPAGEKSSKEGSAQATGVGYVKGNNVYVRSGFASNYYPVTKLNKGDEVRILGEEFGWLQIDPPAGTYSLVDKTYVDRVDDKSGVANGTTWAYAGSNLDNQRYAKQVKLNKGDRVQVLGESTDGAMYKIDPPAGSTLWIKADLIDRSGTAIARDSKPVIEPVKPGNLELTDGKVASEAPKLRPIAKRAPAPRPEPKDDRFQLQVNAIEAEITAETSKPLGERDFEPIIAKLEPIASQTEDEIWQLYATKRIEQLRGHLELVGAVRQIRELRDTAIETANQEAKRRQGIRTEQPGPLDDVVLRGEIWVSGIYDGQANRPKRWRVVERGSGKTLAYIELQEGSPIDPVQYYGKFVGIRASGRRQSKGTIPPVPIYTVQEIVILDPNAPQSKTTSGAVYSASPAPRTVSSPRSQPAGGTSPESDSN